MTTIPIRITEFANVFVSLSFNLRSKMRIVCNCWKLWWHTHTFTHRHTSVESNRTKAQLVCVCINLSFTQFEHDNVLPAIWKHKKQPPNWSVSVHFPPPSPLLNTARPSSPNRMVCNQPLPHAFQSNYTCVRCARRASNWKLFPLPCFAELDFMHSWALARLLPFLWLAQIDCATLLISHAAKVQRQPKKTHAKKAKKPVGCIAGGVDVLADWNIYWAGAWFVRRQLNN